MYRSIDNFISHFYQSDRKALLLTGARQVGKTYSIRKYARNANLQLLELNFALQPDAKNIFIGADNVDELLLRLSAYAKRPLNQGKTLIFLDEIQEYADALTWMKALVEDGRYRYALSGSLLGVELRDIRSLPVGYVTERRMYPMDFIEFIRAVGISDDVIETLRLAWTSLRPVDEYVHDRMMKLYNLYLLVGGMPAAVKRYVDTNNMQEVLLEQQSILSFYKRDIARYNSDKRLYINEIFDLIPSELNAKNKRFILKRLNEHIKFSRHEENFLWLKEADMALPTFNVAEPKPPLKLNEERNLFKLFQNDVGLLSAQYAGGIQLKILQGDIAVNYGAVYENAVAQELYAHGWSLYYFNSKRQGEIDFVVERNGEVLPIEVKSGKDYSRHNALSNLLDNASYGITQAVVLCNDNLHVAGRITYAPVYMVTFMHQDDAALPEHYSIDLTGLRERGD